MKTNSRILRTLSLICCAAMLISVMCVGVSAAGYGTVMVTVDNAEIRQGPGTDYAVVGTMKYGYITNVVNTEDGWGHIAEGWIDLDLVKPVGKTSSGSLVIGPGSRGYVNVGQLNIRQGPGTNYAVIGTMHNGYAVTVLETQDGWGRIKDGWVDLDYLTAMAPTGSNTAPNTTPTTPSTNATAGSRVEITATQLNIRKGAGTGYDRIATYGQGQVVELLEVSGNWGKTNRGWICLDYTTYVSGSANNSSNSTPPVVNNKNIVAGDTIRVVADVLRVRTGAGTNYPESGSLTSGYTTKVIEVKGSWGRIDAGWICLDYVTEI